MTMRAALATALLAAAVAVASASPTCSAGEFLCADGQVLVSDQMRCDGYTDCTDGSDEAGCSDYPCSANSFSCGQTCIDRSKLCDSTNDCPGGEDEACCDGQEPPATCTLGQYRCASGEVLASDRMRCDGYTDCADGSDEALCSFYACGTNEVDCGGFCLPRTAVCDGTVQCAAYDEEACCEAPAIECASDEFFCEALEACVGKNDGYCDCPDCVDEECPPGRHQCASGECLPPGTGDGAAVCNGEAECEDGSDEQNCEAECSLQCPDGLGANDETCACSVCARQTDPFSPPAFNRVRAVSANTYGEFASGFAPGQVSFRFPENGGGEAVCVELSAAPCVEGDDDGEFGGDDEDEDEFVESDGDEDDGDEELPKRRAPRTAARATPQTPGHGSSGPAGPARCALKPAVSAELWNDKVLSFGTISFVTQPEALAGVVSSVFTTHGLSTADDPVSQIIVSFAGTATDRLVTNIKHWPQGGGAPTDYSEYVELPFRWNEAAHGYRVVWTPDYVEWYADDVLLRRAERGDGEEGGVPVPQTTGRVFAHSWGVSDNAVIAPFREFTGPFDVESVREVPHVFCLQCFHFDDLVCTPGADVDGLDGAFEECPVAGSVDEVRDPSVHVLYEPQAQALHIAGVFDHFPQQFSFVAVVRSVDEVVQLACENPFALFNLGGGETLPGVCLLRLDIGGVFFEQLGNAWQGQCPQAVVDSVDLGGAPDLIGGRGVDADDACASTVLASVPFDLVFEQCSGALDFTLDGSTARFNGSAIAVHVVNTGFDGDDDTDADGATSGDGDEDFDELPRPQSAHTPPSDSDSDSDSGSGSGSGHASLPAAQCGVIDFNDHDLEDAQVVEALVAGETEVRATFSVRPSLDDDAEATAAYLARPDATGSSKGTTAFVPNDGSDGTEASAVAGRTMVTTQATRTLVKAEYRLRFTAPVESVQLDVYDFRADGGAKVGSTATLTLWSDSAWGTSEGARAVGTAVYTVTGSEPDGNSFTLSAAAGVHVATGRSASLVFSRGDAGTAIDNIKLCDASRACGSLTFEEEPGRWEDTQRLSETVYVNGALRTGVDFFTVLTGSGAVPSTHDASDRAFIAQVNHRVESRTTAFAGKDGRFGSDVGELAGRGFLTDEPNGPKAKSDFLINFSAELASVALDVYDFRGDGGARAGSSVTLVLYSGHSQSGDVVGTAEFVIPSCAKSCLADENSVTLAASAGAGTTAKSAAVVFSRGDVGTGIDNVVVCRAATRELPEEPETPETPEEPETAAPRRGSFDRSVCVDPFKFVAVPFEFSISLEALEAISGGLDDKRAAAKTSGLASSIEVSTDSGYPVMLVRLSAPAGSGVTSVASLGDEVSPLSTEAGADGSTVYTFVGSAGQLATRGAGSVYAFQVTREGEDEPELVQVGVSAKFVPGANVQTVQQGSSSSAGLSATTVALVAVAATLAVVAAVFTLAPKAVRAVQRRRLLAEVERNAAVQRSSSTSSAEPAAEPAVALDTLDVSDLDTVRNSYSA